MFIIWVIRCDDHEIYVNNWHVEEFIIPIIILMGHLRFNGFINVSKLCSPLSEVGSMVIDDIFHALNKCKHVELELCWSRLKTFLVLFHIRQKQVISSRHGSTFCVLSWFLLLYIWSASHTMFIRHPHPGEGNASDHTARPAQARTP